MARRTRPAAGRRRTRAAPVPFVLAATRPRAAAVLAGVQAQRRREGLSRLADRLAALESAAWRGALGTPGLLQLQRLRVAYAALFAEAGE